MKKRFFLFIPLAALLLICLAIRQPTRFEVKTDKENVVASRLEGKWHPETELTKRLTSWDDPRPESPRGSFNFKSDTSIVQKIPAKYEKFLKAKTIYMAGIMSLASGEFPFILIEHHGNPHVVYFRERDGDPMGDAESFNLILAPARDKTKDLLFTGGDFNNAPFIAYQRIQRKSDQIPPQAKPIADWLKAMRASDLDSFKSAYSQHVRDGFERRGWDNVFSKYCSECKRKFGDFRLADFAFSFQGDENSGVVTITFGKQLPPLSVTKENNEWKIDEN